MEEKSYLRFLDHAKEYLETSYAKKVLMMAISFMFGVLCSKGLVFGKYAPFGVAMVAAVPKSGLWAAAIGAFAGYLIPSPVYVPARYAAALIAVVAIRWSLSELKSINTHPLFAPTVAFLPLLLTGATMVLLNGSVTMTAALYVAESFLGAGCAYFLNRSGTILVNRRHHTVLDSTDVASLIMTIGIAILSLTGLSIAGVSIGRILMVIMIIYCARVGGVGGGAVAGVVSGAVQGLSMAGLSYLSGAYGLGGLMAGVFAPMGKIASAIAFIISHGIASLQVGENKFVIAGAIEVAAATIIYMFLPKSRKLSELLTIRKDTLSGDALRGNIVMRLKYASEALTNVYISVEEISQKLSSVCAPDMQGVYNKAIERICAGCAKSPICWRKYKEDTVQTFAKLSVPIKEKGKIDSTDFDREFVSRCGRQGEMRDEINKNYGRFLTKEAAEIRSMQVREVVEEHFKTTSGILSEMASEFANYQYFDDEAGGRVAEIMRDSGMVPMEVCCRVDKFNRMTIEAEVEKDQHKKINRAVFTKEISKACGRMFSPPCVSSANNKFRIQMCERATFDVRRGFSQYTAGNGTFCGDSTAVFYDGCGRLIAIICDGMGTGGRAAVDGAMASAMAENLLKSGIGFDSMLQTVNSALIAKSGDETLATMDVTTIDLYTGKTEFRKAGAAGSVIRRGKRTEYIESESMPAGIMTSVSFANTETELASGDFIVMVSDGIIASGSEWLVKYVEECDMDVELNHLAEQIVVRAKKERSDGHEDDMSVLVLAVE